MGGKTWQNSIATAAIGNLGRKVTWRATHPESHFLIRRFFEIKNIDFAPRTRFWSNRYKKKKKTSQKPRTDPSKSSKRQPKAEPFHFRLTPRTLPTFDPATAAVAWDCMFWRKPLPNFTATTHFVLSLNKPRMATDDLSNKPLAVRTTSSTSTDTACSQDGASFEWVCFPFLRNAS